MELIRKISIGDDLKNAMHYQVGHKISHIILEDDVYNIYAKDGDVNIKWKSFSKSIVSHVEYDIMNNG